MRPLFSCVIPVKGPRPYWTAALDSLHAQGLGDDLEIIVQDGDLTPDHGQSDAFNRGFARAQGDWFFWLNADDLLLPKALVRVRAQIERNQSAHTPCEWIVGNQFFIDGAGRITKCLWANQFHSFLYRQAIPHVNGPSAFFTRDLFHRVGGMDASLHYSMDFDLWIRFWRAGVPFQRLPFYLWAWRRHEGSKTSNPHRSEDDLQRQSDEIDRMLQKNALTLTPLGNALLRSWRFLDGSYLKSAVDTLLYRGCDPLRVGRGPDLI